MPPVSFVINTGGGAGGATSQMNQIANSLSAGTASATAFSASLTRLQTQLNALGASNITIGLSLQNPQSQITNVKNQLSQLAKNAVTIPIKLALAPLDALVKLLSTPLGLLGFGVGTAGMFNAFVKWPLDYASGIERANVSLTRFLGSQQKANDLLDWVRQWVNKTPLDFRDSIVQMQSLLDSGLNVTSAKTAMQAAADVAAARPGVNGPQATFQMVSSALARMASQPTSTGAGVGDLNAMGIPVAQILAKYEGFGPNGEKLTPMAIDNLKNPYQAAEFMKALEARKYTPGATLATELAKALEVYYGGNASAQALTLPGMMTTIGNTLQQTTLGSFGLGLAGANQSGAITGGGLLDPMRELVGWIDKNQSLLNKWSITIDEAGKAVGSFVGRHMKDLIEGFMTLVNSPIWQNTDSFATKIQLLWKSLISDPFEKWWKSGGKDQITKVANDIGKVLGGALQGIILGVLGDSDNASNAGVQAGKAFFDGFLSQIDFAKILAALARAILGAQPAGLLPGAHGNWGSAAAVDLTAASLLTGNGLFGGLGLGLSLLGGTVGRFGGAAMRSPLVGSAAARFAGTRMGAAGLGLLGTAAPMLATGAMIAAPIALTSTLPAYLAYTNPNATEEDKQRAIFQGVFGLGLGLGGGLLGSTASPAGTLVGATAGSLIGNEIGNVAYNGYYNITHSKADQIDALTGTVLGPAVHPANQNIVTLNSTDPNSPAIQLHNPAPMRRPILPQTRNGIMMPAGAGGADYMDALDVETLRLTKDFSDLADLLEKIKRAADAPHWPGGGFPGGGLPSGGIWPFGGGSGATPTPSKIGPDGKQVGVPDIHTVPTVPYPTNVPAAGDIGGWRQVLTDQVASVNPALAKNPAFINTLLAAGLAESGLDPTRIQNGASGMWDKTKGGRGFFQFDLSGMGAGLTQGQLFSEPYQMQQILPKFMYYWNMAPAGLTDDQKAAWVAAMTERPAGYDDPNSPARKNYANKYKQASTSGNTKMHWAGGSIYEPVVGVGLRSGSAYSFGEKGIEDVMPRGAGGGGGISVGSITVSVNTPGITGGNTKEIAKLLADDIAHEIAIRSEQVINNIPPSR